MLEEYQKVLAVFLHWKEKWELAHNGAVAVSREKKKNEAQEKKEKSDKTKIFRKQQALKIADLTEIDSEGNEEVAE